MRTLISLIVIGIASAGTACSGGKDAPTSPGGAVVDVYTPGLAFSPPFITVKAGTEVRFNISGTQHDVTFQAADGAPPSIPVSTDTVVSRTFNTRGVFPYDCRTHPGMSGSVTVE